jgi:glutamine amidotransferase
VSRARVVVVDYGMGNLRSVANAFAGLPCDVAISAAPAALAAATHVVLPGVGAFGDGMKNLERGGWLPALEAEVRRNRKPFLGICLGMQLVAAAGTEHGAWKGLGWVEGTVTRLPQPDPALRIPHMAWNDVTPGAGAALYRDLPDSPCFYFVHSYALVPADPSVVSGRTRYGADFVASLEVENVHGVQFHPEKSHHVGLAVLRNFAALPSPWRPAT